MEILGISHVDGVEAARKRSVGFRNANEVDVVWHQAIGPDLNAITASTFPQQGKIASEIDLFPENLLPIVPPLGHLVRVIGDRGTRETCHFG
jgi:hypothetical protein